MEQLWRLLTTSVLYYNYFIICLFPFRLPRFVLNIVSVRKKCVRANRRGETDSAVSSQM